MHGQYAATGAGPAARREMCPGARSNVLPRGELREFNPVLPGPATQPCALKVIKRRSNARLAWLGVLAFAGTLGPGSRDAQAQQAAVCTNTPEAGERIECKEDAASTADIDLDTAGATVETTDRGTPGIHAEHKGTGDIHMSLNTRSDPQAGFIATASTTKGSESQGVYANHEGTGDIDIFAPFTVVNTGGDGGTLGLTHRIHARHFGVGDVYISAPEADISVNGNRAGI